MDPSSQFIVPTIIDVPELIVTNEDIDYDDSSGGHFRGANWLNKLQFLSQALSYTIGLGNLWRFPYLCYKHAGGAFLIAYTTVLLIIGMPLFLMELAFGQYSNEGPITIWRISPAFEGIGYTMCLISALVAIYFNMINSWLLHYLLASLTLGPLPWASCDNSWNTDRCFLKPDNLTIVDQNGIKCRQFMTPLSNTTTTTTTTTTATTLSEDNNSTSLLDDPDLSSGSNIFSLLPNCTSISNINNINRTSINSTTNGDYSLDRILNTTYDVTLPANEYFHNNVLELSQSIMQLGGLNWSLLFSLIIIWSLDFLVIVKNLRPLSNRWSLVALIMPYLTLIALLTRALTLPGFSRGLAYYFTADMGRLQNIEIWADATSQLFFSLSPCWGGIITLANQNKFHNNFHMNTMLIVLINYVTSIFVGLVTFAILGHMSTYSGIAIESVTSSGIGFIFMVYTEALAKLPLANLNAFVFFAVLLFLGLNSQLSVMETVITTIVDTWPHKLRYRRPLVLMILCAIMFIISLTMCFGNGFYLAQLLDSFAGTFSGMIVGILQLIAIAWVYGMENFMQDIDDMISFHRSLFPSRSYWYFMWRYLSPSFLFAILLFSVSDLPPLQYRGQEFPPWTMKFGWTLTFVFVLTIPVMAFIRFLLSPGGSFADKISYLCRPTEDWAPSSYVSGPKLINRHHQMLDDSDLMMDHHHNDHQSDRCASIYTSQRRPVSGQEAYEDQDRGSNDDESNDDDDEDLKVVDGRANYIIPEDEDDTDTGLITNETNV